MEKMGFQFEDKNHKIDDIARLGLEKLALKNARLGRGLVFDEKIARTREGLGSRFLPRL